MNFFRSNTVTIEKLIKKAGYINISEDDVHKFINEESKEIVSLWEGFVKNRLNDSAKMETNSKVGKVEILDKDGTMNNVYGELITEEVLNISNGMAGDIYKTTIQLPDELINNLKIKSSHQFDVLDFNKDTSELKALTSKEGETEIILEYTTKKRLKLKLYFNEDPQNMWKDIPSPEDFKPDNESHFLENDDHIIISASRRGRSHANKGIYRDDHVLTEFYNNWTIAIVADGAGSAKLSSLGSKVACEAAMIRIKQNLKLKEDTLVKYLIEMQDADNKSDIKIKRILYEILVDAAHKSMKALHVKAGDIKKNVKDLSTTFTLALIRKFEFGKFVATFQVGDGAVAAYDSSNIDLLCNLDKGEYKSQTIFLNSQSVFSSSESLMKRIFFKVYEKHNTLVLMTDGVVDPCFSGDEEKLKNQIEWDIFWNIILKSVLSKYNLDKSLLEWLNFYIEGEHDDRTITLILDK